MINFVFESYNIARQPILYGDQMLFKTMIDNNPEIEMSIGLNPARYDGAIVNLSLHHNEQFIDNLNADIRKLKWVIIILTSNEFSSNFYTNIRHPNMQLWLQTPKQSDSADKFLPIGFPTYIKPREKEKQYEWFFAGQVNHSKREECLDVLKTLDNGKLITTLGFGMGLEHEEYLDEMSRARYVICPSGPATPDTFRLYEALELGCIPIADNRWYWEKVFNNRVPFPVVDSWHELPQLLKNNKTPAKTLEFWWKAWKIQLELDLLAAVKELKANV